MIPFGADTVTLIRRVEMREADGRARIHFERQALHGCSWRRTERRTRYNETLEHGETVTCRIPADQVRPRAGDYLFLGEVSQDFHNAVELSQALEARRDAGAIIVSSVADNARPGTPLPHWAAMGE